MGHMFKTLFSKTVAETCVWCHPTLLTYGNYIRIAGKELKELWCYLEKRPELEEWAGEADDAFTCHFTPLLGLNLLFLITLSVLTFKHGRNTGEELECVWLLSISDLIFRTSSILKSRVLSTWRHLFSGISVCRADPDLWVDMQILTPWEETSPWHRGA